MLNKKLNLRQDFTKNNSHSLVVNISFKDIKRILCAVIVIQKREIQTMPISKKPKIPLKLGPVNIRTKHIIQMVSVKSVTNANILKSRKNPKLTKFGTLKSNLISKFPT